MLVRQIQVLILSGSIILTTAPTGFAQETNQNPSIPTISAKPTEQQLQQLVAPIALYPDSLVAQIFAASTYPAEIVEADRWLQANPDLKGEQLAQAVNQQSWDPSVKALTEFPSVLENMDKNLSWTSSLGEAYINDEKGVMKAVQDMREKAKKAGNLKSTSQLNVTQQGKTIVIEPANPEVVYVPEYNPWIVYGAPIIAWPGWYWYPGLYWTSPGIAFGVGFGIGFFGGFAWGWHNWAPNWHHNTIIFNHNRYVSHSMTFANRNYYANRAHANAMHDRGGASHGASGFHGGSHGPAMPHTAGFHESAFSGFNHGGVTRGFSARGFSSFHGGGFHGGGRR